MRQSLKQYMSQEVHRKSRTRELNTGKPQRSRTRANRPDEEQLPSATAQAFQASATVHFHRILMSGYELEAPLCTLCRKQFWKSVA